MRILTVNLPVSYLNAIAKLTGEDGLFPSRSELIRVAIREFLINELDAAKNFAQFQQHHKFTETYPDPIEQEPKTVKIPLKKNSEGVITEYKEYKIIPRCELNV